MKEICNICNKRPVSREIRNQMCDLCRMEGEWENEHSDRGHTELQETLERVTRIDHGKTGGDMHAVGAVELRKLAPKHGIKNAGKFKSAELRSMITDAIQKEIHGCWICYPELNEAQWEDARVINFAKPERKSRKGQIINVPLKAPGEVKANVVVGKLNGSKASATITTGSTGTMLRIELDGILIELVWDLEGNYDYPRSSSLQGAKHRKVRNVAEALRIVRAA